MTEQLGSVFVRRAIHRMTIPVGSRDLSIAEAQAVMESVMRGEATEAQIGAWLTAQKAKGETFSECVGYVRGMRTHAHAVRLSSVGDGILLDTCGTGGDGAHTFNISTATSIVVAAAGVRVAKHGNRAVSSRSGSADVLEALGVHVQLTAEQAAYCLETIGMSFLFAPQHHPAMQHVANARRQLAMRTVFNLLGPLANPAGATHQLLGVYDRSLTGPIALALRELGIVRALVVHSEDGLDEISVSAPTWCTELHADGDRTTYEITPEQLGLPRYPQQELRGGDAQENAEIMRRMFRGERGAIRDVVVANAAAGLYLVGHVPDLRAGVEVAQRIIDEGRAEQQLQRLIDTTRGLRNDVS